MSVAALRSKRVWILRVTESADRRKFIKLLQELCQFFAKDVNQTGRTQKDCWSQGSFAIDWLPLGKLDIRLDSS